MLTPRLIVFPGLGLAADAAWPQRALPFEVAGVDFIAPVRGESLASYSTRFAAQLSEDGVLRDPQRTVLGGISFGSAVAQEIATRWPCAGVALLSGFQQGSEIAAWLRPLARTAPYVPHCVDPIVHAGSAFMARKVGNLSHAEAARCAAMFNAFPTDWLREHARMAVEWPGCEATTPRLRVHGDRDWVVPLARTRDVDVILRGDRHLSSIARPKETNEALAAFVARVVR